MITFYAWGAPNPHKVAIALEELGLRYEVRPIKIWEGESYRPEFTALNPNAKVPVIVDADTGVTTSESNAILWYLAEKTGRLLPPAKRTRALELLFFQASSVGPMFGQRAWFTFFAPERPAYAVQRYRNEAERVTGVIESHLAHGNPYFLGDEYSIVDIAFFGWLWCSVQMGFAIDAYPHLAAWFDRVAQRPAVQRGVTIPNPLPAFTPPD